jgi:DNA invertase Pin-like site-specific DNA recombinase
VCSAHQFNADDDYVEGKAIQLRAPGRTFSPATSMVAPVSNGRLVGYARVSTDDQDLSLQIDSLTSLGINRDDIFTENIAGAKTDRPQIDACLATLQQSDTLIVWRLDRLERSMHHLVELIECLRNRGIGLRSVSGGLIDTTSPSAELIFHIFSALAQFERRLIQERTRAGLASARAIGRLGGRPQIDLNEAKVRVARKLHDDQTLNIDDIRKTLSISRSTYYRYAKMKKEN